jgi:hypothetical protein
LRLASSSEGKFLYRELCPLLRMNNVAAGH